LIIAHRGDSDSAPENTTSAFNLALLNGFLHFETDCQLTKDGTVVILHDENLGRTNDGVGCAWDYTIDELKRLDAGSWFSAKYASVRIPTLEDVLDRYSQKAHIHLELKSSQSELPAKVTELITASPLWGAISPQSDKHAAVPGLTITSFHYEQVAASKKLMPEVMHSWLIQEVTPEVIEQAKVAGLDGICPRANALTKEGCQMLQEEGFYVRAWGVKTVELLHHVVGCGVQGATVNWPQIAREVLTQRSEQVSKVSCWLDDESGPSDVPAEEQRGDNKDDGEQ